jgi:phosphate transport system substrate-binding protein
MNIRRNGISTTVAAAAIVIVAIVVAGGAYFAFGTGTAQTTTVTQTNTTTATSTTTSTSVSTSTFTSTTVTPAAINGAGGTLVFPLMSAWTFAYQQVTNGQVNYASVGSGAGIAQITANTVNFGESDAPLTAAQYGALPTGTTLLTIPVSDSAVVPAYNLPGITNGVAFTGDVLAKIFLGTITQWNDPALVALNPSITLPAHAISVFHRSDGSGTMFAFTNYLSDSNAQWKTQVGTATSVNWPTGIGCKGNEGVAGCISNTQYAIGPLEIAYQIINPGLISYGSVRNGAGNFVLANLTNIQQAVQVGGTAGLPAGNAQWTTVSIINNIYNDTKDTSIYPITTFTYGLVYLQQTDKSLGSAVVSFFTWVVNSGQNAGSKLGYPPLPANVVQLDDATLKTITYNGTPLYTGP